jgi:hypothetical protein
LPVVQTQPTSGGQFATAGPLAAAHTANVDAATDQVRHEESVTSSPAVSHPQGSGAATLALPCVSSSKLTYLEHLIDSTQAGEGSSSTQLIEYQPAFAHPSSTIDLSSQGVAGHSRCGAATTHVYSDGDPYIVEDEDIYEAVLLPDTKRTTRPEQSEAEGTASSSRLPKYGHPVFADWIPTSLPSGPAEVEAELGQVWQTDNPGQREENQCQDRQRFD